ncbi:uncharacterized protein LOC128961527 [Oppia nitens]|uniref:uncharacterized protein LOC128961527 n=1 Tax=Oppia nitens TaxID=1686743 RepID=UPI0023D9ACBC|nr:uncharacterized protein LOC128961527 [Oppia nitens]
MKISKVVYKLFENTSTIGISYISKRYLTVPSMREAITKAEICLGYSIKDLCIKQNFNQKFTPKLCDTLMDKSSSHPVLMADKKLDPEIEVNYKSRALLTLLLAKVVSTLPEPKTTPQFKFNLNFDSKFGASLTKQLLLAETIELIHGGCVYHTTGVASNNSDITSGADNKQTVEFLLKVQLKDSRVTELMSKALRDYIEAEYLSVKLKEQIAVADVNNLLDNWVNITCMKNASLLAHGCQSMVYLSTNCEDIKDTVYKFGNSVGFAWNICDELDLFNKLTTTQDNCITNIDFIYTLPMLLYFKSNPQLLSYFNQFKVYEVLTEGEKVVGFPMSYFNVDNLLRDQLDLKTFTLDKVNTRYIAESNHPIVDIARDMFDNHNHFETNIRNNKMKNYIMDNTGNMLLLLLAKVSQCLPSFNSSDKTIIKKQNDFVEIYSMINKALFIHHEAVINLPVNTTSNTHQITTNPVIKRLNDANKISILGGDYLLSYAIVKLANLVNNNSALKLIMCAIDDYCIYHFNNDKNVDQIDIPSNKMTIFDWEEMSGYSLTKMLAYCSQIMFLLAKHSDRYQKSGFDVGYYSQLVWNLKYEMDIFMDNTDYNDVPIKLMSAPVIFHMQSDPKFYDYLSQMINSKDDINNNLIKQIILKGPAIDICNRYLDLYTNKAIKALNVFPDCTAKTIIRNAIFA